MNGTNESCETLISGLQGEGAPPSEHENCLRRCEYPHGHFFLTVASEVNLIMEFHHLRRKSACFSPGEVYIRKQ